MNELEFLKSVPIMKSVNGIEPLVSQGKIIIKKYAKGETLYNQGSSCNSLDIVVAGSLIAYSLTESNPSTS